MRRRTADVPPSRLAARDLVAESVAGLVQRPGRSVLTMLGTVLGVGAFVAVLGLTATAAGQIDRSFSVLTDTTVTVDDNPAPATTGDRPAMDFPADADRRIAAVHGVVDGGVWWTVPLNGASLATGPLPPNSPRATSGVTAYAASPGALRAIGSTMREGLLYNDFHQRTDARVCVLGAGAARILGITRVDDRPTVFLGDTGFTVVGIIGTTRLDPQLLLGVLVPSSTALAEYGPPTTNPAQLVVHTLLGAARQVAAQAPLALRPDQPSLLSSVPPPDPHALRDNVNTDLSGLFLLLATICLLIGAVGIANTTLVAVLERTGEIGLRRSLGARPRHVAAQFLAESTALGTLGGLAGTSLGALTVVVVALARHWTALLDPATVAPAPLIGTLVGLAAGLYPALRASRIEPLDALRR